MLVVPVEVIGQMESVDIDFTVLARNNQHVVLSGKTRQVENIQYQQEPLSVFIYYTPLPYEGFELDPQETDRTYLFVTSIDEHQARARQSFDYASNERKPDELWSSHVMLWNNVWSNAHVEVQGDDELQRQINSAFYYILSSLPPLSTRSEHKQFYGLSPGSLSRGGFDGPDDEDYVGHSFWDTEIWMYPPVLLFYPTLAKEILSYRIAMRESAADNARLFGYEGWRFPWESARTGVDVTPDICPQVPVMPPDEDAEPYKNNSVFTNAVASLSIDLADRVSCITKKTVPKAWVDIASNLYFPFDETSQTHLEYEGFDFKNTTIKQADVVLLGFPLQWPMSAEVRQNDLLAYERLTRASGPAMTWSMHAIGFLELGNFEKAEELFRRSYQTYVRPPFNVRPLSLFILLSNRLNCIFVGMD
ncbi:unnamed protein product [Rotaria sordida]|uniref:Glycoside hydrolase family 65 central catalytic domain-containing protein n=2 Tax=Rotaria sordida TaxID=392033 RepID=A0A813Y6W9_9BILA|nr:unnamed protein product [Rotaria sordida]